MTATPCYRRMCLCVHAANSTALRNTRLTHTSAGSDNRHLRHLDQGGKVHHKAHSPNDHCGLLPEPIHDDRGSESRQRSHTIHGAKADVTKVAVEKACDIVLLRSRQTVGGVSSPPSGGVTYACLSQSCIPGACCTPRTPAQTSS